MGRFGGLAIVAGAAAAGLGLGGTLPLVVGFVGVIIAAVGLVVLLGSK